LIGAVPCSEVINVYSTGVCTIGRAIPPEPGVVFRQLSILPSADLTGAAVGLTVALLAQPENSVISIDKVNKKVTDFLQKLFIKTLLLYFVTIN